MLPLIALLVATAPALADGWDEKDVKKTLEWLAKNAPDKDETKQKAFLKELVGKKVQWPVLIEHVAKTGHVSPFHPAWPQSDYYEIMKWKNPNNDDLRDAAEAMLRSNKRASPSPTDLRFPGEKPWITKQSRGDTGVLSGTVTKIEMGTYIVPLNLADQKKKTLYHFTITIDGKVGPPAKE